MARLPRKVKFDDRVLMPCHHEFKVRLIRAADLKEMDVAPVVRRVLERYLTQVEAKHNLPPISEDPDYTNR